MSLYQPNFILKAKKIWIVRPCMLSRTITVQNLMKMEGKFEKIGFLC